MMNWEVEKRSDDEWLVVNRETKETHTFKTHESAYFIQRLFNEQVQWYNWERHGYNTTFLNTDGLAISTNAYSITSYPQANWKLEFGDSGSTFLTMYLKKGPNWFQRKMFRLILGITWSKI